MTLNVRIKKLHPTAVIPAYARPGDAGMDLVSTETLTLHQGETVAVGTGIALELPEGYAALVLPRSGLAAKYGITVVNAPGLIDSGYRGEVKVIVSKLDRTGGTQHKIESGSRIAQLLIVPFPTVSFEEVTDLEDSERGARGFGSTGH